MRIIPDIGDRLDIYHSLDGSVLHATIKDILDGGDPMVILSNGFSVRQSAIKIVASVIESAPQYVGNAGEFKSSSAFQLSWEVRAMDVF